MPRLFLFIVSVLFSASTLSQSFMSQFIDPQDGWLDASQFLLDYKYGVLLVPVIVTEPAVGEGLGVAAVYFHDTDDAWGSQETDDKGRAIKRSTSAVVGLGTTNGSKVFGGGHFGHYKRDTIRYEGVGGSADINLKFYGTGSGPENSSGFRFSAEALFISQQLAFRLGDSDWFLGGDFSYTDMTTEFDLGIDIPGLEKGSFDSKNVALSALVLYDSLDNSFGPSRGFSSKLVMSRYDEKLGGDFDYNLLQSRNQVYFEPWSQLNVGVRLDGQFVNGDVPFYALPYIEMRGIPALRYQGENVLTGELQAAWKFHPRWQVLGFAGLGRATNERSDLSDTSSRSSIGAGFRYLAVKQLGLSMGLDVAKGPEESVIYVSFGTKFM